MRVTRFVDSERGNRKTGVKRSNTSSNGDTSSNDQVVANLDSMVGKKLKLQQQCNFLPPVKASNSIDSIAAIPPA